MAIFANRQRKNRNNFGKFDSCADLQPSSNFFPKFGLACLPAGRPPPRFRPQILKKFAFQNRKISLSFRKKSGARKNKKSVGKFFNFGVPRIRNSGKRG